MPQMSPQEVLWRLIAGGNAARNDAIENLLAAGGDVLSLQGEEVARVTIVENSTRTFNSTSLTALSGWVLPDQTYRGRPLTFELEVPNMSGSVAASVAFEIRGRKNGGTEFRIGTRGVPVGTAGEGITVRGFLPVAGLLDLAVGDQITGLQIYASTSAGTITINSYWDDAIIGSSPVTFRCLSH